METGMHDVKMPGEAVDEITKVGLKNMAETICYCLVDNLSRRDILSSGNKVRWEDIFSQVEDLARINQILSYVGEDPVFPVDYVPTRKSRKKADT
jgi:hypothetical protein